MCRRSVHRASERSSAIFTRLQLQASEALRVKQAVFSQLRTAAVTYHRARYRDQQLLYAGPVKVSITTFQDMRSQETEPSGTNLTLFPLDGLLSSTNFSKPESYKITFTAVLDLYGNTTEEIL